MKPHCGNMSYKYMVNFNDPVFIIQLFVCVRAHARVIS